MAINNFWPIFENFMKIKQIRKYTIIFSIIKINNDNFENISFKNVGLCLDFSSNFWIFSKLKLIQYLIFNFFFTALPWPVPQAKISDQHQCDDHARIRLTAQSRNANRIVDQLKLKIKQKKKSRKKSGKNFPYFVKKNKKEKL